MCSSENFFVALENRIGSKAINWFNKDYLRKTSPCENQMVASLDAGNGRNGLRCLGSGAWSLSAVGGTLSQGFQMGIVGVYGGCGRGSQGRRGSGELEASAGAGASGGSGGGGGSCLREILAGEGLSGGGSPAGGKRSDSRGRERSYSPTVAANQDSSCRYAPLVVEMTELIG